MRAIDPNGRSVAATKISRKSLSQSQPSPISSNIKPENVTDFLTPHEKITVPNPGPRPSHLIEGEWLLLQRSNATSHRRTVTASPHRTVTASSHFSVAVTLHRPVVVTLHRVLAPSHRRRRRSYILLHRHNAETQSRRLISATPYPVVP